MKTFTPSQYFSALSPPVDFEMLCESLALWSLELTSELYNYAIASGPTLLIQFKQSKEIKTTIFDANFRFWRWLQQLYLHHSATNLWQLAVPQTQEASVSPQFLNEIFERFDDVRTQLQLIHAAVDDICSKEKQAATKLSCLQEQLRQLSTCHCELKSPSYRSLREPVPTNRSVGDRMIEAKRKAVELQLSRLEVPMEMTRPRATLQEDSSAVLYWIEKSMEGGVPLSIDDRNKQLVLEPSRNDETQLVAASLDIAPPCLSRTSASAQQPPLDIAKFYQILAREH
ncbi:hypothetical protein CCR75_007164 [Bremia lactucae]|uniref:Uncharacterized protein n=1 Tax=Bremia lactucae TaxID=4779 RepID=A0A976IG85_BRELC|nr:hypothetical protein CCR75_007164 [Bremia lactucae]